MKNNPVVNYIFKFIERAGFQIISLIVTIVLARLIDVDEYGAIELILVLVSLCQVFVQTGLNSALIQKKNANDMDFSAAFYLNVIVSIAIYSVIFLCAPLLETFYNIPSLGMYLRVCALIIIPASYNSIQNAYMAKNFMFGKQMICCLISGFLAGSIGIILAYLKYGIWSYIIYQISSAILTPLICKVFVKWKPGRIDTFKRVVPIYRYGIKILGASLLETIYNDISSLIIGKKYTASDLAYYGKGKQFPQSMINVINGSLTSVSFPYLSKAQDDLGKIKGMARTTVKISTFVVFPAMIGLAAISRPLIILLLTEKWINSVPFLQLMCVTYIILPIYTTLSQAINAVGKSGVYLKTELIKKVITVCVLIISVAFFDSIYAILIGQILVIPFAIIVSMRPCKRIIGYKVKELVSDFLPPLICSSIMYVVIQAIDKLNFTVFAMLICEVLAGIAVYLLVNIVSNNQNYKTAKEYAFMMLKHTKEKDA